VVTQGVAKQLVIEVAGRPLPAELATTLVSAYVDDSRTQPDLFVLRFRDPARVLLTRAGITVGTQVRLLASTGDDPAPQPLLAGDVTGLEVDIDETGTFTTVRGLDQSHRLFRGRRVASYQNMTAGDICRRVAERAGLRAGSIDLGGPVLAHVAQPNVTDWEFIRRLAEDAGGQPFVVDGELNVTRPARASGAPDPSARSEQNPLVLELGQNLLRCRAGIGAAEQVDAVEVRGWDVAAKRALVGRAPAGTSATLQLGATPAQLSAPFGAATFVATDTAYPTQAQVDQVARSLADRISGRFGELEAVVRGNPRIRAGQPVTLSGVGQPFEGRYTVTSSRHVFDAGRGYETWITVAGRQDSTLLALTASGRGGESRIPGLVTGTVTDTKDPDKLARVKVNLPWLSGDYASDWVRTAQLGGVRGGGVFSPEVGDEVLVGFEQGRLEQPFVLAGLYNGQDKPSPHDVELIDATSGAVNRRTFASRSNNAVELLDSAAGPQGVRLVTGDGKLRVELDRRGTCVTVHSDGTVVIEASRQVSIKAGQGATVDAGNGALELTGNSVKVTARSGVQIDGGAGAVQVSSNGQVQVRGAQVGLQSSARTEINGGASCSISAALIRIN
jgi:phage protein D/phage baseplate assembly protein gpV